MQWKGGEGNNIEDDHAQLFKTNRARKNIVQRMGPNKTTQLISKICKDTNRITEVEEQCDRSANSHKSCAAQH